MEAEVLFEYEKTQDDELNLRSGEIIRDVKQVDDGWCEGELNGLRGMFPDNFVKLRPASQPPPSSHSTPAPAPAPIPDSSNTVPLRNAEPSKKLRRAKVTFSYAADNMDELSLQPGQIVDVLEEEEEGWWRGRIGNNEGVFPSNFVEEIEEEAEPSQPSKPQHTEPPPPVDSQTGERHPPPNGEVTDGGVSHNPKPVRGPMVMPAFDPSKVRAGLKKSTVAPPLEKPPEHKKTAPPPQSSAPKPTEKPVVQAKVTYEYEADNDDELTIRVGDIVEIVNKNVDQQDGWWEVSLRGKRGLIPDNFVELLPVQPPPQPASASPPQPKHVPPPAAAQPKHVPPSKPSPPTAKEPPKQPPAPAAKAVKKPPAPAPQPKSEPSPPEDQADFPVPKTTPLDTSAVKDRPKNRNRPPSRSNLLNHDPEPSPTPAAPPPAEEPPSTDTSKNLSPWQAELMKKKRQPKLAPKPKPTPVKEMPTPAARPRGLERAQSSEFSPKLPRASIGSRDQVSKPEPPPAARTRLNTGGGSKPDLSHPAAVPKPAAAKPVQPPAGAAKPKPVETKAPPPQDTPSQSEPPPSSSPVPAAVVDNSWKEAYEKLKEDFEKFKEHVTRELQILTDDLDKERKHRAGLDIDIDRLKKAQRAVK